MVCTVPVPHGVWTLGDRSMRDLEAAVGPDFCGVHAGMGYRHIKMALHRRKKAVVVGGNVIHNGQAPYASEQTARQRPAARILKRPASVLSEVAESDWKAPRSIFWSWIRILSAKCGHNSVGCQSGGASWWGEV